MSETRVVSFVLRFVQRQAAEEKVPAGLTVSAVGESGPLAPGWHGVVRHVQSREELRFTHVNEALAFIDRYVALQAEEAKVDKDASCFADVNGLRLHYLDYGPREATVDKAPALVFLPGLTANAHMVDGLISADLDRDLRVLALDWRGRGLSDKPESGYRIGDHAADVLALLDHLGLETVTLAGHSFGGLVAFYLAAHYPGRIRRLVLLDSSVLLITERTRKLVQGILDRLGQRVPSLDAYLAAVQQAPYLQGQWDEALARYYCSDVQVHEDGSVQPLARPEAIAETIEMEFVEPWEAHIAAIQQPVLLLNALEPFGAEGAPPILPGDLAAQTVASLARCDYAVVPGNHITMVFGENATTVVEKIETFIKG